MARSPYSHSILGFIKNRLSSSVKHTGQPCSHHPPAFKVQWTEVFPKEEWDSQAHIVIQTQKSVKDSFLIYLSVPVSDKTKWSSSGLSKKTHNTKDFQQTQAACQQLHIAKIPNYLLWRPLRRADFFFLARLLFPQVAPVMIVLWCWIIPKKQGNFWASWDCFHELLILCTASRLS